MKTMGIGIVYFVIVAGAGAAAGMALYHWSERMIQQLSFAGDDAVCGRELEHMEPGTGETGKGRIRFAAWASILAAASVFFFGITLTAGLIFGASLILLAMGSIDMHCMEIPYRLNIFLLGLGALGVFWMPGSWQSHMAGLVVVSVPMMLANAVKQDSFGGGDIFLAASAGLLLGWKEIAAGTMIGMIAAGIYAGGLLLFRKKRPERAFRFRTFPGSGDPFDVVPCFASAVRIPVSGSIG